MVILLLGQEVDSEEILLAREIRMHSSCNLNFFSNAGFYIVIERSKAALGAQIPDGHRIVERNSREPQMLDAEYKDNG